MTGKDNVLDKLDRFSPLAYIALAAALMLPLLPSGYYLALDMQFGPSSFSQQNFQDFYGAASNFYGGQLPLKMALAAVSDIVSMEVTEKILLFAILAICGIGMHMSLPKELGISRYFAGLLYMLNPFVYLRFLAGHWVLLLSYAFFPLAVFSFLDFLKKPDDWARLANAALMAMIVSASSHGAVLLALCYSILLALHVLKNGLALSFLRQMALLAAVSLVLNLYWILPTFLTFGKDYSVASPQDYLADFGAKGAGMPLYQAILTMHGFWRDGFKYTKDIFTLWYVPFLAIFFLAIVGLAHLFKKDAALAVFLASIFTISLFLALGLNGPFAPLFLLPVLKTVLSFMFRDTQKFVWLVAFSFSVLGAYGAYALSVLIGNLKSSASLRGFALCIFMIAAFSAPIVYNYGFFGFIGQAGTTHYPGDWEKAETIMASDSSPGSMLVVPLHMYTYYSWVNNTIKIIGNPQSQFFSRNVISSTNVETKHVYRDINNPVIESVSGIFGNKSSNSSVAESLASLNIRYVFLASNIVDSRRYSNILNSVESGYGLEAVLRGKDMTLFRNNLYNDSAISDKNGKNGVIENRIFYITIFLLMLSLAIAFMLITGFNRNQIAYIALFSALAFILSCFGALGPHQMGFVIIIAFLLALAARFGCIRQILESANKGFIGAKG